MADQFSVFPPHLETPAENAFSITPSDSANLAYVTRFIYVGANGDISCILKKDHAANGGSNTVVTFTGLQQGTVLNVRAFKVLSSNTTATNLLGLY